MSLRVKSLLVFSAAVTLLFAMVVLLARVFIEREFRTIEIERMTQNAERFSIDLEDEVRPVAAAVGDWAPWDELHDFAVKGNADFLPRNLTPEVLKNLRLDFFAIYRRNGSLAAFAPAEEGLSANRVTEEQILKAIDEEGLVPQMRGEPASAGCMLVGSHIVLVAAAPILRTDRTGEPAGTVVAGRIFGAADVRGLEAFAGYRLEILPKPPPAARPPTGPSELEVRIVDATTIEASVPIVDVNGVRIATAQLSSPRPLHVQAMRTIRIMVIGMVSAGGILLFIVWYLLDANVINPVQRLAQKLDVAAEQGRLPRDLGVTGGDELAGLARTIEDLARTVALAEANYRAVVEDQIDFVLRYLPDGRIIFANSAARRYFGDSREDDLFRRQIGDLVAPEDAEEVAQRLAGLSRTSPTVTLEHRIRSREGHVAWLRRTDRALFAADGQVQELQCVAQDVTQARLIRKQLEASERRYRRLFETAVDGILILRRADNRIADANPEFCRMLGVNRGNLLDQTPKSLSMLQAPRTLRVLARLLAEAGSVRGAEITLPGVDGGEPRTFEVGAAVYEEVEGEVVQLNFRDISKRRRANDELRALSGHLMRLQDEERRRIARELHDSTAQNLSALQMAATHLAPALPVDDDRARAALQEIQSLADLCVKEVRTISYLLHPPLLDEVGLLFALRWYVDGYMTRTERIVRLDVPESLERLDRDIETTIFRIVQEGLTNVHRHSGARRVWIRLAIKDGTLTLEIRDDGKGLPKAVESGSGAYPVLGVGIAGMRERLRQFGGALDIESSSRGTIVRATLPLHPHGVAEEENPHR